MSDFNVLFIGAGNVMFGSDEGPWNHSIRFEKKLGSRLRVVAVVDPAVDRAHAALQTKCTTAAISAYKDTRVYKCLSDFVNDMSPANRPRVVVIGSPPMFRGTTQPGKDIEMQILQHFPGVAMFVEKPVTTGPNPFIEDISETPMVAKSIAESQVTCSVGYLLRYLKAVQMMKKIIQDNNLTVVCTIARYACAYESIQKPDWWDKSKSAGPVIEQATHFCDLSRYFGGEVDLSTINAHSLEWYEDSGRLSKIPIDETKIPPEDRVPRVTAANWKYRSGAVGSFVHLATLQGTDYSCEFEVFADGYALKLVNPYMLPVLHIRKPGDDEHHRITFTDDDPFFTEVSNFINVVENANVEDPAELRILSTYEDAYKSYELTWAIRLASERSHPANSRV